MIELPYLPWIMGLTAFFSFLSGGAYGWYMRGKSFEKEYNNARRKAAKKAQGPRSKPRWIQGAGPG